jgi:hypothetical protein
MSIGLARTMGDESEALLLPLLDHDVHVGCCSSAEYLGWGNIDMGALEARRMGCQEVEKATTWLVESQFEEVDEKNHDMGT